MNNSWKEREKILQDDSRKDFIEKRNKQTKDFGKERIFSLFQEWYTFYKENPSDEKFKFTVGSIIEKIKQQKNKVYLKGTKKKSREAAAEIASLFGKFIYVTNKVSQDINKEFSQSKDVRSTPKIQKAMKDVQLSLFDELFPSQDKENKESSTKENKESSFQDFREKEQFNTIDLDALYASDPDEPWRNR